MKPHREMTIRDQIARCSAAIRDLSGERWSLRQAADSDVADIEGVQRRLAVLELVEGVWQQRLFMQMQDARSRPNGEGGIARLDVDSLPIALGTPLGTEIRTHLASLAVGTGRSGGVEVGLTLGGFVYRKCWLMAVALHRTTGLPLAAYLAPHPCGSDDGRLSLLHAFVMDTDGEYLIDVFGRRKLDDVLADFDLSGKGYEHLRPVHMTESEVLLLGAGPRGPSRLDLDILRLADEVVPVVLELVAEQRQMNSAHDDVRPAPGM